MGARNEGSASGERRLAKGAYCRDVRRLRSSFAIHRSRFSRLTIPTTRSSRTTGTRLIRYVVSKRAISAAIRVLADGDDRL